MYPVLISHSCGLHITSALLPLPRKQSLYCATHLTQPIEQRTEPKRPPLDSDSVDQKVDKPASSLSAIMYCARGVMRGGDSQPVSHTKQNENPQVSPLLRRIDIQPPQVLVAICIRAISALSALVRVDQISLAGATHKVARKVQTSLSRGRIEVGRLGWRAPDPLPRQRRRQHTSNPVGAGEEIVQLFITDISKLSLTRAGEWECNIPNTAKTH